MNKNKAIHKLHTVLIMSVAVMMLFSSCGTGGESSGDIPRHVPAEAGPDDPVVYFTSDISPEGLEAVYEALGVAPAKGDNVGVKLHTGASDDTYYLRGELIGDFVKSLNGTVVECNTALGGGRSNTAYHYQLAEDHGFTEFAPVVILDENGSIELPVEQGKHITTNLVGAHFTDYDFYVVLSHFKGHMMGGFVIKN